MTTPKPTSLTVNDLMLLAAEGDEAAINILDMIDEKSIDGKNPKQNAEIYNATGTA